jgi:glycosyltransferase involved in cell wall biosynthesis
MANALKRRGCEISFFLHLKEQGASLVRLQDKMTRLLTGRHIICERDPRIARHFPEQINASVSKHPVEAVLGTSAFYMAVQNCSVPSIFWGDTTVAGVLDSYPYYKHVTKRSIRDSHKLEQAALNSSALAVFSNQWAADVACANYSFDQRKVRVIPYGVNTPSTLNKDDIVECLHRRDAREFELLLVGVDWKRSGARFAIETTSILRARGVNIHLTLVGCVPPSAFSLPEYVTVIRSIDRSTQKGQALLASLYIQSHLLILPNRAESCAVTLSEASAYGVPSLGTDVGGNGTFIKNGVNGQLFPLEAEPADYADYALKLLGDPQRYAAMCWRAFERFQTDLNWDVAVSKLIVEMKKVLGSASDEYACTRAS